MRFLISLLLNGLILYGASAVLSGVSVSSFAEALVVVLLLSLVNTFIRPIITFLTLPITILTLGLFLLVINGGMILLVDYFLQGFYVDGWFWAIVLAIIFAFAYLLFGGEVIRQKRTYT